MFYLALTVSTVSFAIKSLTPPIGEKKYTTDVKKTICCIQSICVSSINDFVTGTGYGLALILRTKLWI